MKINKEDEKLVIISYKCAWASATFNDVEGSWALPYQEKGWDHALVQRVVDDGRPAYSIDNAEYYGRLYTGRRDGYSKRRRAPVTIYGLSVESVLSQDGYSRKKRAAADPAVELLIGAKDGRLGHLTVRLVALPKEGEEEACRRVAEVVDRTFQHAVKTNQKDPVFNSSYAEFLRDTQGIYREKFQEVLRSLIGELVWRVETVGL